MQLLIAFTVLFTIFGVSISAPTQYDQRQDGKINVHAKLENFLIIIAPSSGLMDPSTTTGSNALEFAFPSVLEAFDFRKGPLKGVFEKNNQKHWQNKSDDEDNKAINLSDDDEAELTKDIQPVVEKKEAIEQYKESKLIGDGIENCGPGRRRDQLGICQSDGAFRN